MIQQPEFNDLEKEFLAKKIHPVVESNLTGKAHLVQIIGEVFLSLIISKLHIITDLEEFSLRNKDQLSGISLYEFFHLVIDLSDIISVDNQMVVRMEDFLKSNDYLKSVKINLHEIVSILSDFSFQLEEDQTSYHLNPNLLSILSEFYPQVSMGKKKSGKYYTLPTYAFMISQLVVFRFLREINNNLSNELIFASIFEDKCDLNFKNQICGNFPSELRVLDPACGSGTFLIQLTRLLCEMELFNGVNIRLKVEAVDLDPISLLVTRLRFFLLELFYFIQQGASMVQIDIIIRNEDFLFRNNKLEYNMIIGNPPYIRHEDIGSGFTPDYKEKLIEKVSKEIGPLLNLDKKCDLYIYFCLKCIKLLKSPGILGFLTSNAWLEVNYGKNLQDYIIQLLSNRKLVRCEIISQAGIRFWKEIGINSIIFLAVRNSDTKLLSGGVYFSESNSELTEISKSELKKSMSFSREAKSLNYRTEFIAVSELSRTNKWAGNFLRASRDERRIINVIKGFGVPLQSIADVTFGIKTGANDFFHLFGSDENKDIIEVRNKRKYKGQIERQYLVPLIKSPSEILNFSVSSKKSVKDWLFYCQKPKNQLRGTGALEYILWGENEVIPVKQGRKLGSRVKGFDRLSSVSERKLWYSINPYSIPHLLWAKSYHDKPGCFMNQGNYYPDQRFYSIYPHSKDSIPLVFTYLNSSFVWAQMEQSGNTNMGLGVLDTNVYWLKSILIPQLESPQQLDMIKSLAKELEDSLKREPITRASKMRMKIDEFFRLYFGLTNSEFRILVNFIKKNIERRLASNQYVTKDN